MACARSPSSLGCSRVENHAGPLQLSVCRSPSSDRQGRDGMGGSEGHLKPVLNLCLVCPSPPLLDAHSGARIQCAATARAPAAHGPSPVTSHLPRKLLLSTGLITPGSGPNCAFGKTQPNKLIPCPLLSSKGSGPEAGHSGRGPWPLTVHTTHTTPPGKTFRLRSVP